MPFMRIATVGCLLLAGLVSGCGDGSDANSQAPAATDSPDAGEEASKKIMQMQPPPPPGKPKR